MSDIVSSAAKSALLNAVLDTVIPAELGFPSAGTDDIAKAFLKDVEEDGSQGLLENVLAGLPEGFPSLPVQDREDLLRQQEKEYPTGFSAIVRHVFNAYYTDIAVREILEQADGYPARPPHYAGYELEPFDPDSLSMQREREPFWRKV